MIVRMATGVTPMRTVARRGLATRAAEVAVGATIVMVRAAATKGVTEAATATGEMPRIPHVSILSSVLHPWAWNSVEIERLPKETRMLILRSGIEILRFSRLSFFFYLM